MKNKALPVLAALVVGVLVFYFALVIIVNSAYTPNSKVETMHKTIVDQKRDLDKYMILHELDERIQHVQEESLRILKRENELLKQYAVKARENF